MRWRAKTKHLPKLNERRIVSKFALWPTRVNYYWVWLERYYCCQKYCSYKNYSNGIEHYGWKDIYKSLKNITTC